MEVSTQVIQYENCNPCRNSRNFDFRKFLDFARPSLGIRSNYGISSYSKLPIHISNYKSRKKIDQYLLAHRIDVLGRIAFSRNIQFWNGGTADGLNSLSDYQHT